MNKVAEMELQIAAQDSCMPTTLYAHSENFAS